MQQQDVRTLLQAALPEVRTLREAKIAHVGNVDPDDPLAQYGLRDGADIVAGYIAVGECGLVLEHLCYMIAEAELSISSPTYAALEAAAEQMQMQASLYWQHLKPLSR